MKGIVMDFVKMGPETISVLKAFRQADPLARVAYALDSFWIMRYLAPSLQHDPELLIAYASDLAAYDLLSVDGDKYQITEEGLAWAPPPPVMEVAEEDGGESDESDDGSEPVESE